MTRLHVLRSWPIIYTLKGNKSKLTQCYSIAHSLPVLKNPTKTLVFSGSFQILKTQIVFLRKSCDSVSDSLLVNKESCVKILTVYHVFLEVNWDYDPWHLFRSAPTSALYTTFSSHLFNNVGVVLSATLMSTNSYSTYHKEEYKDT